MSSSSIDDVTIELSEERRPKLKTPTTMNELQLLCKVCGDKASGLHYGVYSCEGCKGFFRRTIHQQIRYRACVLDNACQITKVNRNRCQTCRFRKCIDVGMSKDAVKYGRIPKKIKARLMAEMMALQSNAEETDTYHNMEIHSSDDDQNVAERTNTMQHEIATKFGQERRNEKGQKRHQQYSEPREAGITMDLINNSGPNRSMTTFGDGCRPEPVSGKSCLIRRKVASSDEVFPINLSRSNAGSPPALIPVNSVSSSQRYFDSDSYAKKDLLKKTQNKPCAMFSSSSPLSQQNDPEPSFQRRFSSSPSDREPASKRMKLINRTYRSASDSSPNTEAYHAPYGYSQSQYAFPGLLYPSKFNQQKKELKPKQRDPTVVSNISVSAISAGLQQKNEAPLSSVIPTSSSTQQETEHKRNIVIEKQFSRLNDTPRGIWPGSNRYKLGKPWFSYPNPYVIDPVTFSSISGAYPQLFLSMTKQMTPTQQLLSYYQMATPLASSSHPMSTNAKSAKDFVFPKSFRSPLLNPGSRLTSSSSPDSGCDETNNELERESNRSPTGSLTTDLAETKFVQQILAAHQRTCHVSKYALFLSSCQCHASEQSDKNVEDFGGKLSAAIREIVDFARHIPGFVNLSQQDQVRLLKAGFFEVFLVRLASQYVSETDTLNVDANNQMRRQQLYGKGMDDFVDAVFDFSKTFSSFNLNETHLAIYSALLLCAPDRQHLKDKPAVERLNEQLLTALCWCNQLHPSVSLPKLLTKLAELRSLNETYSNHVTLTNENAASCPSDSEDDTSSNLGPNRKRNPFVTSLVFTERKVGVV